MTLYEILDEAIDIPIVYQSFIEPIKPPFIAYTGTGQDNVLADNSIWVKKNRYRLEYYFINKNEELEDKLENILLENGYIYNKSNDLYLNDEKVVVIYYDI